MEISCSNLGITFCVQELFLTFRTIFVHNMFSLCSAKRRASDKDSPVRTSFTFLLLWSFCDLTCYKSRKTSNVQTSFIGKHLKGKNICSVLICLHNQQKWNLPSFNIIFNSILFKVQNLSKIIAMGFKWKGQIFKFTRNLQIPS